MEAIFVEVSYDHFIVVMSIGAPLCPLTSKSIHVQKYVNTKNNN